MEMEEPELDCAKAADDSTEVILERIASNVCGRMKKCLSEWVSLFASKLEELKHQEQQQGKELGFEDTFIARMIAVEALVRIFDSTVPESMRMDKELIGAFYETTLPSAFYRGHVEADADWRVLLCDSQLIEGPVRQLDALSSVTSMLDRLLLNKEYLVDFRIAGLQCVISFLTPGGKDDDISSEFMTAGLMSASETRSFVLRIVQGTIGVIYYVCALILAKERGTPAERMQQKYMQEAASKRTIGDVLNSEKFSDSVNDLAAQLATEVVLKSGKAPSARARRTKTSKKPSLDDDE